MCKKFERYMSKILVNDHLHGLMGERVLWDFMLEGIPDLIKVDINVIKQDTIISKMNVHLMNLKKNIKY